MKETLEQVAAHNATLLREAMRPFFAHLIDASVAELSEMPVSMLSAFVTPEVYGALYEQYRAGMVNIAATNAAVGTTPESDLGQALKFILWQDGWTATRDRDNDKQHASLTTLNRVQTFTVENNAGGAPHQERINWETWWKYIQTSDHKWHWETFSDIQRAELEKLADELFNPAGAGRGPSNTWVSMQTVQTIRLFSNFWSKLVFIILLATGGVVQTRKYKLSARNLAVYTQYATAFVEVLKMGA
jgi:hypothetical protein